MSSSFHFSRLSGGAQAAIVLYSAGTVRLRSSKRVSARSFATSLSGRSFCGIPNASAVERIFCSPRIGTLSFPSAAHLSASITSRACIPCWAAPAAAARNRFRATIRSASAPQTPRGALAVTRQGPILQIRQHIPARPNEHCGFWRSKRSNGVSIPSCSARRIRSRTAGSGVRSMTSCFAGKVFRYRATASL